MRQCNPLMAQLMRGTQATSPVFARAALATRGGGGSWHRPDPKPYPLYKYTRRYHLEDINANLYSDFAPEFHMHLHSMWLQSSKQTVMLMLIYFLVVITPCWLMGRRLTQEANAVLKPSVRNCEAHAHMLPAIYHHLKNNNAENAPDKFGRMNATFYKNWVRQENGRKYSMFDQMEKHL